MILVKYIMQARVSTCMEMFTTNSSLHKQQKCPRSKLVTTSPRILIGTTEQQDAIWEDSGIHRKWKSGRRYTPFGQQKIYTGNENGYYWTNHIYQCEAGYDRKQKPLLDSFKWCQLMIPSDHERGNIWVRRRNLQIFNRKEVLALTNDP